MLVIFYIFFVDVVVVAVVAVGVRQEETAGRSLVSERAGLFWSASQVMTGRYEECFWFPL